VGIDESHCHQLIEYLS